MSESSAPVRPPSRTRRFFRWLGRLFSGARRVTANVLFALFLLLVIALVFGGPGGVAVPSKAALVIAPKGVVVEQASRVSPLAPMFGGADFSSETVFRDLLEALEHAGEDKRIELAVLDLSELTGISPAHLRGLGRALETFKTTGKQVLTTGNGFSQAQFYIASFADAVYMHPMGSVIMTGFGGRQNYYRGLFEKLSINVHVYRVGTYKDAVEPFILDAMSDESRAANQALLDELWADYRATVAHNRDVQPDQIDTYVGKLPELVEQANGDFALLALEHGLVDELLQHDETRTRLISLVGESEGTFSQIGHADYLEAVRQAPNALGDQVGVIVAKGMILPGEQPPGAVGAESVAELIRQARKDERVKALVFRVDSPGGTPMAAELVRHELELAQLSGKPVVVSMAGAAASGGYWVSATADQIWAEPTTITGSIGIFGVLTTFETVLDNIGVSRDGVATSELAASGNPFFDGVSPAVARITQASVEAGYRRFINVVARGRDMEPDAVDAVGQGRVWSGATAHDLGLVDELGSLSEAIGAAAALAQVERYEVRYIEKPLSTREQLLKEIAESFGLAPPVALSRALTWVDGLEDVLRPDGVYAICEPCAALLP